jgi:hypothetical protein
LLKCARTQTRSTSSFPSAPHLKNRHINTEAAACSKKVA